MFAEKIRSAIKCCKTVNITCINLGNTVIMLYLYQIGKLFLVYKSGHDQ
jgi:hypothetical protein